LNGGSEGDEESGELMVRWGWHVGWWDAVRGRHFMALYAAEALLARLFLISLCLDVRGLCAHVLLGWRDIMGVIGGMGVRHFIIARG